MRKRRVSLKDIASQLGVSVSTVSRALKDHPDLSTELIRKVKALAAEWNYTPNPLAMGLLKQQTHTIGVIVPDIVTHFYSSIISGIEAVAKENSYYIVISSSQESYENEKENLNNLLKLRVDGLIVCLAQDTNDYTHFNHVIDAEVPLVFFDRICRTNEVSSVVIDNKAAAKKSIIHLFENGSKKIAHIAGPSNLNITKERIKGYKEGLIECGLVYDPNLLVHSNLSVKSAAIATNKLLSLKNSPDAIFGVNDTVIFSAMKEIKKRGLKIPEDIALVGFTDDFHATVVEPSLTAITHPTFEIGKETAQLLLKKIKTKEFTVQQIIVQTQLVIRESSVKNL